MGNADRKSLVLAKIETTYNTDAVPTAVANAIVAGKVEYSIGGRALERDVVLPTFGKLGQANVGESIKLSFPVEVRGSGTAGTVPRIGCLLRACNLTETINAGVSVSYDPNSTLDAESVTLYFYADNILHKATGCVGNVKLSAKAGDYGKFDFEFTGMYSGSASSDASPAAPTFGDAATVPRFISASFAFQTIALAIESFEVDLGNSIGARKDANSATGITRYFINDRAVKGSFDPAVTALSTFNPWTKWDQATLGAITATIGSSVGNRLVVSSPNCSLTDAPKYGAREGERIYQLGFGCYPTLSAGNNEIQFLFS
jgi:hypothetical protein